MRPNTSAHVGGPERRWTRFKPILHQLYVKQGRPLSAVKRVMEAEHDFDATDRQYRSHFTAWGWSKRGGPSNDVDGSPDNIPSFAMPNINASYHATNMAASHNPFEDIPGGNSRNIGVDPLWSTTQNPDFTGINNAFQRDSQLFNDGPSMYGMADGFGFEGMDLDLQSFTNQSRYPLHQAAQGGYKALVQLLLERGTPADIVEKDGATPLWLAAQDGHHEIVEVLHQAGADLNVKSRKWARQAIHQAAQNGHVRVVEYLVANGAAHDEAANDGETPLWLAVQNGKKPIVKTLLKKECRLDVTDHDRQRGLLHLACQVGHQDIVQLLLDRGCPPDIVNTSSVTPLWIAAQNGFCEIVEMLHAVGANLNVMDQEWRRQPLHQAIQAKHFRVVKYLLQNKAQPDRRAKDGETPLWLAATNGELRIVQALLAHDPDLLAEEYASQRHALHQAAQGGHLEVVQLLLEKGCPPDVYEADGATPLWLAAQDGHYDIVEMLHRSGANLNAKSRESRRQPLHQATANGHERIVKYLLANGAEPDCSAKDGRTALWIAAAYGNTEILKDLIKAGARTDVVHYEYKRQAMHQAAQAGHIEAVQLLLDAQCHPDVFESDGVTPLWLAAQDGFYEVVKLLHEAGADLNIKSKKWRLQPIHQATASGHTRIVEYLLKSGAEHDYAAIDGETPLLLAAGKGLVSVVTDLLAQHARLDTVHHTSKRGPLHQAAQEGHLEVVQRLIKAGASLNQPNADGATALWLAAQDGHYGVVEALHKAGADLNWKASKFLRQPLHQAAQKGNVRILEYLLDNGANPDYAAKDGETPLFLAATQGDIRAVTKLLAFKARPNAIDYDSQRQALHQAAQAGHEYVVRELLNAGVKADVYEADHCTPLWLAAQDGKYEVVKMLHEAGADLNVMSKDSMRQPIHQAAQGGHAKIVEYLLNNHAEPDRAARDGQTALWLAANSGHYKVVELLLAKNASINVVIAERKTEDLKDKSDAAGEKTEGSPKN